MATLADVPSRTIESSALSRTALLVVAVVLFASCGALAALVVLPWPWATAFLVVLATLVMTRHFMVLRRAEAAMDRAWARSKRGGVPDAARLPSSYFLYILGSGGHTGELCEMIKQQFRPHSLSHRRYIITSGDEHSEHAVAHLEGLIGETFPGDPFNSPGGTWDVFRVVRARRVHQPLWTTWYSAGRSALSIVQALVRRPHERPVMPEMPDDFDLPHLIVTNGPGTGFVVCVVAHVLKMLGVIPANRCSIMYIETWAHVSTLSLTGKLFYYSGLPDIFVVQHEALAAKIEVRFIGEVTKYGNLLGIKKKFVVTNKDKTVKV